MDESTAPAADGTVGDNAALAPLRNPAVSGVEVGISVMLGQTSLRVHQMLKLGRGAVVEFKHKINDPVDVFANEVLIARGEVTVTDDDRIGVTLTEIVKNQN